MAALKRQFALAIVSYLLFFNMSYGSDRGIQIVGNPPVNLGKYYAYIIGINAYSNGWEPLQTAVKDAKELKETLIGFYDFDETNVLVRLDEQATQVNIIEDLKQFAATLREKDNFIIYYAGHGQLDSILGDGYWIPFDGAMKNPGTWVSHSIIKNILGSENLKAKNIALISDSCYSGALLRGGPSTLALSDKDYGRKILSLASLRSRQVFTSGGVEPVADGGRDGHSLFAFYFLKALKENQMQYVDLENLFYTRVWKPVAEIGDQRPYVGRLKSMMDENGQFVLLSRLAKDKINETPMPLIKSDISTGYRLGKRLGIFPMLPGMQKGLLQDYLSIYTKETLEALGDVLKKGQTFGPVFSYYDLKGVPFTQIESALLPESLVEMIWINDVGPNQKKIPNEKVILEIAQKVGVDYVYLNNYYDYRVNYASAAIDMYLFDVNNKKMYHKEYGSNRAGDIPRFVREFFASLDIN
jgi:hypothetical protein